MTHWQILLDFILVEKRSNVTDMDAFPYRNFVPRSVSLKKWPCIAYLSIKHSRRCLSANFREISWQIRIRCARRDRNHRRFYLVNMQAAGDAPSLSHRKSQENVFKSVWILKKEINCYPPPSVSERIYDSSSSLEIVASNDGGRCYRGVINDRASLAPESVQRDASVFLSTNNKRTLIAPVTLNWIMALSYQMPFIESTVDSQVTSVSKEACRILAGPFSPRSFARANQ